MPYLDSVEELLEAKEGEHVQFKEAKNRFDFGEAARCCCALANDGGGKLVFGISDKRPRSVVGSRAFEQPERTRMGLIDKLKINVDFQLFTYEEKRVLVFDVKSRPIGMPVLYEGVAWIYDGDTLCPMPEDMRRRIAASMMRLEQTSPAKFVRARPLTIWMRLRLKISVPTGSKKAAINSLQHGQGIRFSLIVVPSRIVA